MPSLNGNFFSFFFAVFKKCILIFGLILCWVCGHPRSNSVFLFGFYRRRRCSQFHGSMQLDMAGSWTKTQACSKSGPSTQVSRHAFIYMQTLRTIFWDEKDLILNKMHSAGKYVEGQTCDPKTWKANFRCAMNSLPDIEEVKDRSVNKGHQAMRVFRMLPVSPKSRGETTDRKRASTFFFLFQSVLHSRWHVWDV